jgi:hypothetical protein
MKRNDKLFILGLYLFNLGSVSVSRTSNDLGLFSSIFGVIIGGCLIFASIEGNN